ncbi:hypothetical protein F4679DRAFT_452140 [Xylaria curta]|nr:hypothetical protein F4679DRAFT_452140 [Xylaria curta]
MPVYLSVACCFPFARQRVITRSQTRSNALAWISLPAEIRLMILEIVACQKYPGWASLASVCREWQHVLEKVNFHKIKLRVPCLAKFRRYATPQKRELIRHICLDVVLPQYNSKCCSRRRSPSARISCIVSDGIWKLFSILRTWGPAKNLALEINVYSPSDCEHCFKNIYLSSDAVNDEDAMTDAWRTGSRYHDPQHGWMHGRQVEAPPRTAILQLFRPIHLVFHRKLPQVQAVTCLIIRRQFRRCISPSGLGLLLSRFNRLEHIFYEPWLPYEAVRRESHEKWLSAVMRDNLPNTLNKLTVFEDSYEFYDLFPERRAPVPWFNLFEPSKGLGAAFASKSLDLQHLAISFMVNAEEFFRHCQSTWIWSSLQSLALTSQLLQNDWAKRDQIEALLYRAGLLAQKMPELRTFVLWNGGKNHACAFIYRADRERASVTWRGTWLLELRRPEFKPWQLAAAKIPCHRFSELRVKQELVRGVIRSHGDAIHHLKLPCQVIDPRSLWQIRREAYSIAE